MGMYANLVRPVGDYLQYERTNVVEQQMDNKCGDEIVDLLCNAGCFTKRE